jgi:MFS family permease
MNTAMGQLDNNRRWAIMGAVMLGLFLSAMDQTIVGTAMPRIIAELSGLKLYSWVFTAYMLASTTSVPIVGKMGDIYGRKNLFLLGIVIFLAGSILSGTSQSMIQLIIFRGVQGLGGGLIFANAFAIVGDLFTPAERGKYAGMMTGVFDVASVIGPLVGGGITDNLSWRWVFYVNIPLGLVALFVLATVLPASKKHDASRKLDYAGAVLLAATIAPLLLGFSWAGNEYAWGSPRRSRCRPSRRRCSSSLSAAPPNRSSRSCSSGTRSSPSRRSSRSSRAPRCTPAASIFRSSCRACSDSPRPIPASS